MIVYPKNWEEIGKKIPNKDIEEAIVASLKDVGCKNITLSGGVDSSLLLHYMSKAFDKVNAYTIGCSLNHPDVVYAKLAASRFKNVNHKVFIPTKEEVKNEEKVDDMKGDVAVRLLYKYLEKEGVKDIVAADGIDEFAAGYYAHQKSPDDYSLYYDFVRKLQHEQLQPLNRNSFNVKVYLPYLDNRVILLLSQVPLIDKVDRNTRKKIIYALAKDKVPEEIIARRKYGFCDALSDISEEHKSNTGVRQGTIRGELKKNWWDENTYKPDTLGRVNINHRKKVKNSRSRILYPNLGGKF